MASETHILGIRHHGPGSARSVLHALEQISPDVILIEGPPDANEMITLAAEEGMKPPVALLIYRPDEPRDAVYYPFALYSPEWQAIQYGCKNSIPVKFIDLPASARFGLKSQVLEEKGEGEGNADDETEEVPDPRHDELKADPLGYVAKISGYEDSERWWEQQVEQRQNPEKIFEAIHELMQALRDEADQSAGDVSEPSFDDRLETLREAHMRQKIREAVTNGGEKIAVVCGAWHVPALAKEVTKSHDAKLLKGLPKTKTSSTWIPWTYERMTFSGGYGAGVQSPGYYHHLWSSRSDKHITSKWMTKVARLLRSEDLQASTASVIEAARLADALASLRGRPIPGLGEMNDASISVFCLGDETPLQLIKTKLIVGNRLGKIPEKTPMVPLQENLAKEQKRLRLKPEAGEKILDLDLRKPMDLERSYLLHRLNLLNVHWAEAVRDQTRSKGTFHECWKLRWDPGLVMPLIEACVWGNSIRDAAEKFTLHQADTVDDLSKLCSLSQHLLLADLPDAVSGVMKRVENVAAVTSDIGLLIEALPPLVNVMRYGNVRKTDVTMVQNIVDGLVARTLIGLPGACSSLNDDAALEMSKKIDEIHRIIGLLQNEDDQTSWNRLLEHLAGQDNLHGLLAGRCSRILADANVWSPDKTSEVLGLALSSSNDPLHVANWVEGFLRGGALLLIHNPSLWALIDDWVTKLSTDQFMAQLPLLRRAFSAFSRSERTQLQALVGKSGGNAASQIQVGGDIDIERAKWVLPVLKQIYGVEEKEL